MRILRRHRYPLIVWIVAFAAAAPLLALPGLLNSRGGGDSPFLLQRLHQLSVALADGHFPVRWMPDANYGDGYPFFNFYAPLSIYIAALFRALGFSFVRAIQLAQLAGFLVAGMGAFRLGRRWLGGPAAGVLTAIAYTVAPFHLVNVYVRGDSLAEFWAMAFYPWLLLAGDRLLAARAGARIRPLVALALLYAGLILSHNISALIFSPFLLLFLALRWLGGGAMDRDKGRPANGTIGATAVALALGLALAAWFFIPALAERELAQLGPVTEGYFHYGNHFREQDLVQRGWFFDYDVAGGKAFRMGLVQALVALAGGALLVGQLIRRRAAAPGAALFVLLLTTLSTFMITPLSNPLWKGLPLLAFSQFPWRFLSVQALGTALLSGVLATRTVPRWVATVAGAALLVAGLALLPADYLRLTDADVTAERLAEYEWFTANIGTTVSAEYLPPTVQPRPYSSAWLERGERNLVQVVDGALTAADLVARETVTQRWQMAAGAEGATVVLPLLGWPGWEVTIDSVPVAWTAASSSGRLMFDVPPGEHTVALRLHRTPVRLAAEGLSLAALMIVAALLWRAGALRPSRRWGLALAALLAVGLLARLWPQPPVAADDLTWDFDQLAYLHHSAPVVFADGTRLETYRYDSDSGLWRSDEIVAIVFSGNDLDAEGLVVDLVTPAVTRFSSAPALVAFDIKPGDGSDGSVVARAQLPHWIAPGLYVPRLRREAAALTPDGRPRGELFLRPVRIVAGEAAGGAVEGDWAWIDETGLGIRPLAVNAEESSVTVILQYFSGRPLPANYLAALRLVDDRGRPLVCPGTPTGLCQLDIQPGYGWRPSAAWPPGRWVSDVLALPAPAWPEQGAFAVVATLYDGGGGTPLLTRRLAPLYVADGRPRVGTPPLQAEFNHAVEPLWVDFADKTGGAYSGGVIRLEGYDRLWLDGPTLQLTPIWRAQGERRGDYVYFFHLVDPTTGAVVAQRDAMPRNDSYPTGQWAPGEVVFDQVAIDVANVPPGTYDLVAGLYSRAADGRTTRLTVTDSIAAPILPDNRVHVAADVVIQP